MSPRRISGAPTEVLVREPVVDPVMAPLARLPLAPLVSRSFRVVGFQLAGYEVTTSEIIDEPADLATAHSLVKPVVDLVRHCDRQLLGHIRIVYVYDGKFKLS